MIKIFTLNKNGKIELTKEQLENLLLESFLQGSSSKNYYTYEYPYKINPYKIEVSNSTTSDEEKLQNLASLHHRSIY